MSVPEAMPFYIPLGAPIPLETACRVAEAAQAEAARHDWKMAIAIVDPAGALVLFLRIDDTQYASAEIAQAKARAAATFRRSTKVFQDGVNGGQPALASLPGVVASEGGLPLIENGVMIGAIGCSGGAGAQDGVVAAAGAAVLKP